MMEDAPVKLDVKVTGVAQVELCDDGQEVTVNQYQMGKVLGEGAFGIVRAATDDLGDRFAVKCLSRSFLKKKREFSRQGGRVKIKTALDDVLREIAIMKKTKHPNLVSLIEVIDDETGDMLYMVLEFVEGGQTMYYKGDKHRYFTPQGGEYTEQRAKELGRDCINGIMYLHKQGIIHRDLKPENLLLTSDGQCKIADFGIAQKLELEKKQSASISNMQGTHQFMAPEMISESKYNGFLIDVWAFGVCLYIFVCGNLPFWGDNADSVFDVITNKPLSIPDTVSPEMAEVLRKIMEKDPKKRLTMEQICQEEWFDMGAMESINTVELTEEDELGAITPMALDFAAAVRLKLKMGRWKKHASSLSKSRMEEESTSPLTTMVPDASEPEKSEPEKGKEENGEQQNSGEPVVSESNVKVESVDKTAKTVEEPEKQAQNDIGKESNAKDSGNIRGGEQEPSQPPRVAARSNSGDNGCCVIV
mmetsp:Transcript_120/g.281  ORF Transcript_120/g.281 Transcript_120/m.281 type:complete len:475 (+) Transcript_120:58-1482(+)